MGQGNLVQRRWCLVARKSDRRTVRGLTQLLAAEVEEEEEAVGVAAAIVRVRDVEPGGWVWRAGAATASLGIG